MNDFPSHHPPRETPTEPILAIRDLRLELTTGEPIVEDVTLEVAPGEIVGLVGESGSGKTTTALALLGYARPGVRIGQGEILVAGETVSGRDERGARRLRGRLVSYVPQDPGNALNPALRIRSAIQHMLDEHAAAREVGSVESALANVHLPSTPAFVRRYPHQLSGGQQQRVTIAMALVCEPPLVVLDEPTTGLDVVTQARILEEIERLRRERGLAMVYVSHDLAVVAQIADRIAVLYAGRVVEQGPSATILTDPKHPYTRGLVASIPDHVSPRRLRGMPGVAVGVGERPRGCAFAPRCPQKVSRCEEEMPLLEEIGGGRLVRCFEWRRTPALELVEPIEVRVGSDVTTPLLEVETLRAVHGRGLDEVVAADEVSFALVRGECVALVGESGSGKTTIARCVAGLHAPAAGKILLDGEPLAAKAKDRPKAARRRMQIVFQNPYDSLNPRHRVGDAIARPARVLRDLSAEEAASEVAVLLERVRLPARLGRRFPGELSGGERQRVAIARALAAKPDLLVCDEVTSALDVSVQAALLEVLAELRAELGLALLFITHDLGVVASVADRVLVLDRGIVCEQGTVGSLLASPSHPYTQRLIEAAPRLPSAARA
jgi:peptide/nickel transport system ATP-binding protein